jgi:hypothetical protein
MGAGTGEKQGAGRGTQPVTAAPMMTGLPAVIYGKRQFVWTWTPIENGMKVRFKWVVRIQPVGGMVPMHNGQIMTHTRSIPHCHASPIKQFTHDLKGHIMNFSRTHRVVITVLLWLIAIECITIIVAHVFGYHPDLGGLRVGLPMPLYVPGAFLGWGPLIEPKYQWIITLATLVSVFIGMALVLRLLFDISRNRGVQDSRVQTDSIYGGREQAKRDHLL